MVTQAGDKVISLGSICITGKLLQRMGLKTESYPFDWIYSAPNMVAHCLDDDFTTLLDKSQFVPHLEGPGGQCFHKFYNDYAKHKNPIFNHHDPSTEEGYRYFQRCVDRFRAVLSSSSPKLLVLMYPGDNKAWNGKQFETVVESLQRWASNFSLLYLMFKPTSAEDAGTSQIINAANGNSLVQVLTQTPMENGVRFLGERDNEMVGQIIVNAADGAAKNP